MSQASGVDSIEQRYEQKRRVAELASECDPELVEWAYEQGEAALKGRMETGRDNSNAAATMLTLLLAGIGGSFAYAVRLLEGQSSAATWGAAASCAYLFVLAVRLFYGCIKLSESPAAANDPKNLLFSGAPLSKTRPGALADLQERLDQAHRRNELRGNRLDAVRLAAIYTPLAFGAGAACFYFVRSGGSSLLRSGLGLCGI